MAGGQRQVSRRKEVNRSWAQGEREPRFPAGSNAEASPHATGVMEGEANPLSTSSREGLTPNTNERLQLTSGLCPTFPSFVRSQMSELSSGPGTLCDSGTLGSPLLT